MSINRPYKRTCRQFVDGSYTEGGCGQYMIHPHFANSPSHYVRAFLLILKDLQELFDYVEPADENLSCYSYRIHSLLMRSCIEIEANCKAILQENGYTKATDMNMGDYRKIEVTHLLSSYEIKIPHWSGVKDTWIPFQQWASGGSLPWYRAYNATKHDRHNEFKKATFEHLLESCCALLALLSAQFATNNFSPIDDYLIASSGDEDGMETGIGEYFRVKFPTNFPLHLRYDFDWQSLKGTPHPFQEFDYNQIS